MSFGRPTTLFVAAMLCCSCELIDYHPYYVGDEGGCVDYVMNRSSIVSRTEGRSEFSFAFMGDSHSDYDELVDAVEFINSSLGIDFVVHAGDLSDYGTVQELQWTREILDGLNIPYQTVIGNHDIVGKGDEAYRHVFGDTDYAFLAGDVYFICYNSNSNEYKCDGTVPDIAFMTKAIEATPAEAKRTLFISHTRPDEDQFDKSMAEEFEAVVRHAKNPMVHLSGHVHNVRSWNVLNNWVISYSVSNVGKRQMFVVHIKSEGYEIETVDF